MKIFEETNEVGGVYIFDGKSTVTATYDGPPNKGTYTITKDNNTEYLTMSGDGDTQKFTISSISNTNLSLSLETLNDSYLEGGKIKTAAKSVLTQTFIKK
ncbi:hypothetical protein [Pedobacter sp. NJ-S-72]